MRLHRLLVLAVCCVAASARADQVDDDLAVIARTGPQGAGSVEARAACDRLAQRGIEILPRLLVAMDTGNPVAANWCRSIYEPLVARELARDSAAMPGEFLRQYAADPLRAGRARRLVLELLDRLDPAFRGRLAPTLLDDDEFRGDAVAAALAAGEEALAAKKQGEAMRAFRRAFEHARDPQQVTKAVGRLKQLGEDVNAIEHLGLVDRWWLIGAFPAPDKTGYQSRFPPEDMVDLAASYPLADGQQAAWRRYEATDPLGQVNLIDVFGHVAEVVGYAYTEIDSSEARDIEVRCGADDNCTVWLNGQRVFGREQWLNGTRFDRFRAPAKLVAGRNALLVKVCQGPQHKNEEVPNNWSLQLRLCDQQGKGVPFMIHWDLTP